MPEPEPIPVPPAPDPTIAFLIKIFQAIADALAECPAPVPPTELRERMQRNRAGDALIVASRMEGVTTFAQALNTARKIRKVNRDASDEDRDNAVAMLTEE